MFELTKEFRFEASHVLPFHSGKCARLHGHSWKMSVTFMGQSLKTAGSETGMLMDFGLVKKYVQPIVDEVLDHRHLNDSTGLASPTSEELARWLFRAIRRVLPSELLAVLWSVRVEETCTSAATYRGGRRG